MSASLFFFFLPHFFFFYLTVTVLLHFQLKVGAIIILCDVTATEAHEVIHICYDIQEKLPDMSAEREEFYNFIRIARDQTVHFTAADFFRVDRGVFYEILNVIAVHVIIVNQFLS